MTATVPVRDLPAGVPARPTGIALPAFQPTGPDVLGCAAGILPQVCRQLTGPGDVHAALLEVLDRLGVGTDRYHRLRLADEAQDMLAAYLVTVGHTRPQKRVGVALHGWIISQDLAGVRRTLARAAGYWRRELDPDQERAG